MDKKLKKVDSKLKRMSVVTNDHSHFAYEENNYLS